jgi:transposase
MGWTGRAPAQPASMPAATPDRDRGRHGDALCDPRSVGDGAALTRGRDFAAWLGLVPKQISTGDRTILGRITKRGNRYLRMLFLQAARVVLLRPRNWMQHSFGPWLAAAAQRLHHNVLATALANKLARIAWSKPVQHREYEARLSVATA